MWRVSIIFLALLAAAALAAEASTASAGRFTLRGTVSRVVDGDTVDVRLTSGRTERIRLIGIDTPERGECDAAAATAYARSLAQGRAAVLQGDPTQAKRDRYGRLLAYVWIGSRDLGQQQLARGLAKVYVYDRPFQRLAVYQQAERTGKTRSDGIWRACSSRTAPPAPATPTPAPPVLPPAPSPVPPPPPPTPSARCDASYPDVCIPPPPPDLDCKDVPYKKFRVVGADPHRFDSDRDGIGCES